MQEELEQQERHLEVLRSLQESVAENLNLLGKIDRIWQPTDFLPDLTGEDGGSRSASCASGRSR
jgi:hypothetical protein